MIKQLLQNWKTTSAGITAIGTAVITVVYAVKTGKSDASTWTGALSAVLVGVGLLFAGDSSLSAQAHEESTAAITDLKSQVQANTSAIVTGDTTILTKSQAGQPAPTDPKSP